MLFPRYTICIIILLFAAIALYLLAPRLIGQVEYLHANNLIMEKSYSIAADRLKNASYLVPGDYRIKKRYGDVCYELGLREGTPEYAWPFFIQSKELFLAALRLNPLDSETLYGLARVESRIERIYPLLYPESKSNPHDALPLFKEAIRLRPNSILFRHVMARYMYRHGNPEIYQVLEDLCKVYPPAYFNLRREPFWSPEASASAMKGLKNAVDLDISPRQAHNAISYLYEEEKSWKPALDHYIRSLGYRSFENRSYNYVRLGTLYIKNSDMDNAEESFLNALRKSDNREKDIESIYGVFKRESVQGMFPPFYEKVKNRFIVTTEMDILFARALFDLGDYKMARDALITLNQKDPVPKSYYWLARVSEKEEDWDSMELAIHRAAVLDPENSEYRLLFSSVLGRLKKYQSAEKEATLAIKYRKDPAHWLFNHRAWLKWRLDDYEGALKDWQSAISLKPDHAPYYAMAGEAYAKQAYWPLAREFYEKALTLDPGNKQYKKRVEELK